MSPNTDAATITPWFSVSTMQVGTITANNIVSGLGVAQSTIIQDSISIGNVVIPYKDIAEAISNYKMCVSKIELLEEKIDYLEKLEEERGNLPRKKRNE